VFPPLAFRFPGTGICGEVRLPYRFSPSGHLPGTPVTKTFDYYLPVRFSWQEKDAKGNGLFAFDTPAAIAYDSACLRPHALQGAGPARGLSGR